MLPPAINAMTSWVAGSLSALSEIGRLSVTLGHIRLDQARASTLLI